MALELNPILPFIVGICFFLVLLGYFSRKISQPYIIAYILAGVLLGNLGLREQLDVFAMLGDLGIILIMFFIGMNMDVHRLLSNWKTTFAATILQVCFTVLCMYGLGQFLDWSFGSVLLFGFAISLTSTAVTIKILESWNAMHTQNAQNVIGISIAQDILVVPMLIIIALYDKAAVSLTDISLQLVGAVLMIAIVAWIVIKGEVSLPIAQKFRSDTEMEVFLALGLCFCLSLVTGLFGLSSALGAVIAGMFVASAKEAKWIDAAMNPIKVIFVTLFFLSIGMYVDFTFFIQHWALITGITLGVLVLNTLLNACILRVVGSTWKDSFLSAALLSNISELSFLLATIGLSVGLLTGSSYQMMIQIVALSLMLSPMYTFLVKKHFVENPDLDFDMYEANLMKRMNTRK
jgi:monovalent cation:H+ antiporter-2, CPA2 family